MRVKGTREAKGSEGRRLLAPHVLEQVVKVESVEHVSLSRMVVLAFVVELLILVEVLPLLSMLVLEVVIEAVMLLLLPRVSTSRVEVEGVVEVVEEVTHVGEREPLTREPLASSPSSSSSSSISEGSLTVGVVLLPLLGIREDGIGVRDLAKLLLRSCCLVLVRMVLEGEFAEGALDLAI